MTPQKKEIKILLIDDDEDDFIITKDLFLEISQNTYRLDWEMSYETAKDQIRQQNHDVYLIDYNLGSENGLSLIQEALAEGITRPMILLTGKGDKRIDLEAMDKGAADFLVKAEITPDQLERTIRYSLNHYEALNKVVENEHKYRQLFERSIDAIFLCNADLKVVNVNPSFSRLLRYRESEISGKDLGILFDDDKSFNELKFRLNSAETPLKNYEAELSPNDQEKKVCQVTMVRRLDHNGDLIGYQGIIHDISLRKRAEEQLLLAERLTMTGKLARSIAHEIRNPLTNLRLAIDQLVDEIDDVGESEELYRDIIHRNVNRIDQLITDLLNSSKPKKLSKQSVTISDLMNDALNLVMDRLTLMEIKLEKKLTDEDLEIHVDPEKMKVALVNILVNAIEAMKAEKGELQVSSKVVDESVYLRISDNGSGMKEEDLAILFDPFYTSKKGGMGLGLTTTQNIIHGHNGEIRVNSKPNEGTSFTICIPRYHS